MTAPSVTNYLNFFSAGGPAPLSGDLQSARLRPPANPARSVQPTAQTSRDPHQTRHRSNHPPKTTAQTQPGSLRLAPRVHSAAQRPARLQLKEREQRGQNRFASGLPREAGDCRLPEAGREEGKGEGEGCKGETEGVSGQTSVSIIWECWEQRIIAENEHNHFGGLTHELFSLISRKQRLFDMISEVLLQSQREDEEEEEEEEAEEQDQELREAREAARNMRNMERQRQDARKVKALSKLTKLPGQLLYGS